MSVIGIDEVGRGAWAGPLLVVAARQKIALPLQLKDSKLLSKNARQKLFEPIKKYCDIGEGWVMPQEIDKYGLSKSMYIAVERALHAIDAHPREKIVMDGNVNYCDESYVHASAIIDADALFPIVSAASIVAKVLRDTYMSELPERYAKYEFDRHVGYGTVIHAKKLAEYGVTDLHRKTFKPVRKFL